MSLFDSIKNAIFGSVSHATSPAPPAGANATPAGGVAATPPAAPSAVAGAAPGPAISSATLDASLARLSASNGQKLNWQTSIVDLMKLVGLDPSLSNRKLLAQELGYKGDTNDSAAMNVWLHKEVMDKLAQSGGQVPPALKA